jgi:GNAT superfamily N-acetyltransferase
MATPAESQPPRPATQVDPFHGDDIEAIAELARNVSAHPDEALGNWEWSDASELERELDRWRVSPTQTLFVAREAGRVVGFCGVECYPSDAIGLVHGPVVDASARGRGIGRALFEVALRTAGSHGASELWAATGRDNRRGQALLGEAGFARDGACALFHLEHATHTPIEAAPDVRRATSDDLSDVLALAEALGDDIFMSLDELAEALADPRWQIWIAGLPNALSIACIDPDEQWVRVLATHEEARRRGLGAAVLSAALEAWWADRSETPVCLTVRADSLANLTQYRRLGFEPRLVVARFSRAS